MRQKHLTEMVQKTTEDCISSITDLVLYSFFLTGSLAGTHTHYDIENGFAEAQKLSKHINYKTLKTAFYNLSNKKLIRYRPKNNMNLIITKQGQERLEQFVPVYQTKRPWDGHLYLISYDIPNKRNYTRNLFRTFIRKTGAALLQESLWLTPYNPTLLIEKFVEKKSIFGTVLVSRLGSDGTIGDETLTELLSRVYHLPTLAKKYTAFIEKYKINKNTSLLQISFNYLSILKSDPQLPFKLLPQDFPDRKAYELFLHFTRR